MKAISLLFGLLLALCCGAGFAQSGSISGSPNPCTLSSSSGTCTATISWSSSGGSPGVFLRETNQLVAGTPSGSYSATYVNINGYHFDLRASYTSSSSALLASVFVVGVLPSGNISASPNPCTVTSGSSCTSTISWSSSGAAHAGVFLRETGQLVGGTTSGTYSASYINTSGYHFDLRSDYSSSSSTLLASVFVTANQTPSGQISASPNPCTITTGSSCTSTISWSSSAAPQAGVFLRETGQLVAGTGSGSYSATFINTSGYHFDLRVNYTTSSSTLIASVFVTANPPVPSGQISASPSPCAITTGSTCTSTINWSSTAAPQAGVFVRETGQLVASGSSGAYSANNITASGYNFDLRLNSSSSSSTLLASTFVHATTPTGSISASPNPCYILAASMCSTTLTWTSSGAPQATLFLRENGTQLASGASGSFTPTYINVNGYHFDLHSANDINSSVIASANPIGIVPTGSLSASHYQCAIPSGGNQCTTTLTWGSVVGASTPGLFIRETGQLVASGTSGSYAPTYINVNGYNFDLRAVSSDPASTVINSVYVVGTSGARAPLVGAIRWDNWFGSTSTPGQDNNCYKVNVEPTQWQYRWPFFTTPPQPQAQPPVPYDMRSDSQTTMDQEIGFASSSGLNYWAFLYNYWSPDGYEKGLSLYQSSTKKSQIGFSLILQEYDMAQASWTTGGGADSVVSYMADPMYVKVAGGRPLLYVLSDGVKDNAGVIVSGVQAVTNAYVNLHGVAPYVVIMGDPSNAAWYSSIPFDAVGAYAISGWAQGQLPYSSLAYADKSFWDAALANYKVVPTVTSGWDPRPRIQGCHGTSYGTFFYTQGTPSEIAGNVQHAIAWVIGHSGPTDANAVLIYAWNEVDEGGWIVPTLNLSTNLPDTSVLDTIRQGILAP